MIWITAVISRVWREILAYYSIWKSKLGYIRDSTNLCYRLLPSSWCAHGSAGKFRKPVSATSPMGFAQPSEARGEPCQRALWHRRNRRRLSMDSEHKAHRGPRRRTKLLRGQASCPPIDARMNATAGAREEPLRAPWPSACFVLKILAGAYADRDRSVRPSHEQTRTPSFAMGLSRGRTRSRRRKACDQDPVPDGRHARIPSPSEHTPPRAAAAADAKTKRSPGSVAAWGSPSKRRRVTPGATACRDAIRAARYTANDFMVCNCATSPASPASTATALPPPCPAGSNSTSADPFRAATDT